MRRQSYQSKFNDSQPSLTLNFSSKHHQRKMFRKATDDKQLADENSDDRREQNLARGRALLPATKPTSIEPQRQRLGGGVLLRLGEVVEEAPAGLDVDVHVPGELPERHRRLPGQPGHQILRREPPHETTAKNPAHGCHRQRQGPPGSHHCCSCSQEPTELGGGEEAAREEVWVVRWTELARKKQRRRSWGLYTGAAEPFPPRRREKTAISSWVVIGSAWVWIWFCFCFASPAVSAPDFLQLVVVLLFFYV